MAIESGNPARRGLSRRLVHAARDPGEEPDFFVGDLIASLGDRSFGWCIVIFSLIAMLPLPPGATLVTALPLILVTAQMALGMPRVWMPAVIARRRIRRRRFQQGIMRLRPLMRPIERLVRPRHPAFFAPRAEQTVGVVLLAVSFALALPIPFSAYLPAAALLVGGIGLVERDGRTLVVGLVLGALSLVVTVGVGTALLLGVRELAHAMH